MGVDEDISPAAGVTGALKLMAVLAHPDDESLGTGGLPGQVRFGGSEDVRRDRNAG